MQVQQIRTIQFDSKEEVITLARTLFDDEYTIDEFVKTVIFKIGYRKATICICDGSTDCTIHKAFSFKSKDGKIVCVIPKKNPVSARRLGRTEQRVYEFLRMHPYQKFRIKDLCKILNMSENNLSSTLRTLKKKGFIFRDNGCVWVADYQQDVANIFRLCENIRKNTTQELCKYLTLLGFEKADKMVKGYHIKLLDNVTLIAGENVLQVVVDKTVFERKTTKSRIYNTKMVKKFCLE